MWMVVYASELEYPAWDRLQPIPNPELDKWKKMEWWLFTSYESILIKYLYNKKIWGFTSGNQQKL